MSTEPDTVVITGANEGIGHHMATALLEGGYRVAAFDIDEANLQSLGERYPTRLLVRQCDVTDTETVEAAVASVIDRWGRIDVLVNNAAVLVYGPFEDQRLSDLQRTFDVNYFGYVRLIRAVLPHMKEQGGGIIHNVSSGAGVTGYPGLAGYASTKGAIEALARSLRFELADENVHVTRMHPTLAGTRSAARLGYPDSALADPEAVGRGLATKIHSTDRAIYYDWKTRLGISLSRRFPSLVKRGVERTERRRT